MRTYEKASDWFGLVLRIALNKNRYLTGFQICNILYKANRIMEDETGILLFNESESKQDSYLWYESIDEMSHGVLGLRNLSLSPTVLFTIDCDLIQLNAIRKAMNLPVIHSDFTHE